MKRRVIVAMGFLAAAAVGCGSPNIPGRRDAMADPGGPVSLTRHEWGSTMCRNRDCIGRCASDNCGVRVTLTGVRMPERPGIDLPAEKK